MIFQFYKIRIARRSVFFITVDGFDSMMNFLFVNLVLVKRP